MVQRFLEIIPGILFQTSGEKDQYGRMKVDCRFPGSIGRGIIRKDGPLIEVRTYLTDPELTKKQLKDTKILRNVGDRHNFDPEDVKTVRMLKSGDFAEQFDYELKQLVDLGCDEKMVYTIAIIGIYITKTLIDLNYADANDIKFWQHHGEVNKYVTKDLAEIWHDHKPIDRTFVEKVQQIFINDGIKDYNIVEFVNYWFKIMKEDIEQFENNNN